MTRFNTQLVHGLPVNDNNTGAVNPPIYNSSTYAVESVNAMPRWDYARSGNPTRDFLEKQIAQLTDEEKETMCDIVCEAGADYIKTSTGFSTAGANFHDVELMVKGVHGRCKVKAAGGISTVEDMETFLALGADRLGTSRAVKILNGEQAKGY